MIYLCCAGSSMSLSDASSPSYSLFLVFLGTSVVLVFFLLFDESTLSSPKRLFSCSREPSIILLPLFWKSEKVMELFFVSPFIFMACLWGSCSFFGFYFDSSPVETSALNLYFFWNSSQASSSCPQSSISRYPLTTSSKNHLSDSEKSSQGLCFVEWAAIAKSNALIISKDVYSNS